MSELSFSLQTLRALQGTQVREGPWSPCQQRIQSLNHALLFRDPIKTRCDEKQAFMCAFGRARLYGFMESYVSSWGTPFAVPEPSPPSLPGWTMTSSRGLGSRSVLTLSQRIFVLCGLLGCRFQGHETHAHKAEGPSHYVRLRREPQQP